jgi:hypothetical protein
MAKSKRKRVPNTVLKLPDLEQSKSAVLNSVGKFKALVPPTTPKIDPNMPRPAAL